MIACGGNDFHPKKLSFAPSAPTCPEEQKRESVQCYTKLHRTGFSSVFQWSADTQTECIVCKHFHKHSDGGQPIASGERQMTNSHRVPAISCKSFLEDGHPSVSCLLQPSTPQCSSVCSTVQKLCKHSGQTIDDTMQQFIMLYMCCGGDEAEGSLLSM